ncbi:hypothetical protein C4588_03550, partial [Candidatus Parcubacteria bacterium]
IGLTMGSDQNVNPITGIIKDSVILEGTNITSSLPRGWGVHFDTTKLESILVDNNVVANVAVNGTNRMSIYNSPVGTYTNNIVWNWPTVWGNNNPPNDRFNSPGPFKDSTRTLNGYQGLPEAQVIEKIRNQSRDTFDAAYTAESLNIWVREGFVAP